MPFGMGIDIGYSNVKLVMGEVEAAPQLQLRPAGAAPVDRLPERMNAGDDDTLRVLANNEHYAACVSPERLQNWNRVLHENYPGTASYQALYHAALLLSEQPQVDWVVTGLPVAQWLDQKRRTALAEQLRGEHAVTPKRTVVVEQVRVIPQPGGGYLDLLAQHPSPELLNDTRVLVIDPGFFSVDWVFVVDGEIRHQSSGTSHQATSVLLEQASRLITTDHGGKVSRERLEQALRLGKDHVVLFGQPIDTRPYLERAGQHTVGVALTALQESLRNETQGVDVVLLVGGGARFFEAAVRHLFPGSQVLVPQEPVFANARGFWYFGQPGRQP
ncbi:MAG: ParM/StbA family protein [Candidatus Competibacteraceae bacterium]